MAACALIFWQEPVSLSLILLTAMSFRFLICIARFYIAWQTSAKARPISADRQFLTLMKMLKSENTECIVTALSCLSKITEDNIYELDSAEVNYPLNDLIPLFISFFQHPSQEVVYHSVSCMRNSIDAMPNALLVNMDAYLQVSRGYFPQTQALSWLLTRTNDETLALICNSLVSILSLQSPAGSVEK